jgi:DNA-binding NarL/FixJ family response regulator
MSGHDAHSTDFIGILVADSTRIHTQLLADAIGSDSGLQVVASASSSQELLAAVGSVPVDVVVISYGLDDHAGRGLDVLREIRALRPAIKGIILLDSSRPQDVLDCFRAGAKGVFSKHERLESLCKCIRCVHEGQIWARSVELDLALEALANSPMVRAANHKGLELLSSRERQVVQHLSAGMTNREIAELLKLSPHTVKNYLFRIFDKLGVSSRTELLYLTMNSQRPAQELLTPEAETFAESQRAAETGIPLAQLRLADHYLNGNGVAPDPVSAYMWVLVCRATMESLHQRLETGEREIGAPLSPEQLAEAERRAAHWLAAKEESKKKPAPAELIKKRRTRKH